MEIDAQTAYEVYGATGTNTFSTNSERERAVSDVFAVLLEIEIITFRRRLKTKEDRIHLVHPVTKKPIAIGLEDLERRDERFRQRTLSESNNDTPITESEPAVGTSTNPRRSIYEEISNYYYRAIHCPQVSAVAQRFLRQQPPQNADVQLPTRLAPAHTASSFLKRHRRSVLALCFVLLVILTLFVVGLVVIVGSGADERWVELSNDCILLIGGRWDKTDELPVVEYYHPSVGVKCNRTGLKLSVEKQTARTSGCFLTGVRNQVVLRESDVVQKTPSRLYDLDGGSTSLPLPSSDDDSVYITGSTAASFWDSVSNSSICLSCSGCVSTQSSGGCYTDDRRRNDCHIYNNTAGEWRRLTNLPAQLSGAASAMMDQGELNFYVFGGFNGSPNSSVYRYNIRQGSWSSAPPMDKSRDGHAAVTFLSHGKQAIVTCGGYPDRKDCSIYNGGSWSRFPPMAEARYDFALVNFNGSIYALGGATNNQHRKLNSVEVYDPHTDSWKPSGKRLKHSRDTFVGLVVDVGG